MNQVPDVFGQALRDYFQGQYAEPLLLHTSYGAIEEMPIATFFRTAPDQPDLERRALELCQGKVFDIGAGVGSHALELEKMGLDVTAIDQSRGAVQIMQERGLKKVLCGHIQSYETKDLYDTLLLMMNGIGLAGKLIELKPLLWHLKSFLKPGGQLLFDSCDITYLYQEQQVPFDRYYGEVDYRYEYKNHKGAWFRWLFVDQQTLKREARAAGWRTEIIYQDELDQYLAQLTAI
ncbi:MAG: class I SAM-dependent methyltransferase [Cyclobacteriaceae bacterium]